MLRITVTTVEREVLQVDDVTQVTIPTMEGEITVLPGHVALMAAMGMGEMRYQTNDGREMWLFVDGGVLQIDHDKVEILTEMAERADEIDAAKVEEAKRRAEKLLLEQPVDVDLAAVNTSLQRELARLKLSQKYQHKAPPQMPDQT